MPSKGDMSDALDELGISYMICKYYPSFSERKKYICVIKGVIRELVNYFAVVILYFRLKNRLIDIIHTNSSVSNIGAYLSVFLKFGILENLLNNIMGLYITWGKSINCLCGINVLIG